MKKLVIPSMLALGIVLTTSLNSIAQFGSLSDVLSTGGDDASAMFQEYLRPVTNSLGANLNSGWYNTAKVHQLGGFHITFTTSVAIIPDEAKTYNLSELGLGDPANDLVVDVGSGMAKTAMGERGSGPEITYTQSLPAPVNDDVDILSFSHPGGLGIGFFPSPMISAGIGLIKDTEINGRFMPAIKYGTDKENSVGLWGVGIKHSLKQWIPVIKNVPAFQLSLQYGYTNLKWHTDFNPITPLYLGAIDNTTGIDWDDQSMDFTTTAHTANLLVGANIPVVCFYGGVGLSIAKTNLITNGWYPIPTVVTTAGPDLGKLEVTNSSAQENLLDLEIKNEDGSIMKPRLNAGIRFKLAVITIHFDYAYANYSVATAGLGISWR
jgi:hypothetical protein